MTTPIVTREEFLQWIMEQPDEKMLNWNGLTTESQCRCPMAEYTVQRFPRAAASAGYSSVRDCDRILWQFETNSKFYFGYTKFVDSTCHTYGQLKASLKQKGLV